MKLNPIKSGEILVFVIGFLSLFYLEIGGQLYISEILLIFLAPVLWLKRGRALLKNVNVRIIMYLGALWFFGQVLTDIIRQTPYVDLSRGWASIFVFLISFSSLYLLLGPNIRRVKIFAFGYILSGFLVLLVQPSPYFTAYPWKFGFGQPVTLLIMLLVVICSKGQLNQSRIWSWLIIAVGIISIFLGSRSLGGITILSVGILWLRTTPFTVRLLTRPRVINLIIIGLLIVGFVWGILEGYVYFSEKGHLGQNAINLINRQYNGNVWGLFLGGRVEILASSQAILDSPIIGHGSWARDFKYRLNYYSLTNLGYQIDRSQLDYQINSTDLIPAHSHITQAWVWAGVLGAIFWIWILVFVGKVLIKVNILPNELYLLVIYLGISAIWDILFSPFGSFMRIVWIFRFMVFLTVRVSR